MGVFFTPMGVSHYWATMWTRSPWQLFIVIWLLVCNVFAFSLMLLSFDCTRRLFISIVLLATKRTRLCSSTVSNNLLPLYLHASLASSYILDYCTTLIFLWITTTTQWRSSITVRVLIKKRSVLCVLTWMPCNNIQSFSSGRVATIVLSHEPVHDMSQSAHSVQPKGCGVNLNTELFCLTWTWSSSEINCRMNVDFKCLLS